MRPATVLEAHVPYADEALWEFLNAEPEQACSASAARALAMRCLPRHQLYLVVLGEWAAAIAFSLWWMRRFRFGRLEWLWRALTYGGLPKKDASDGVR